MNKRLILMRHANAINCLDNCFEKTIDHIGKDQLKKVKNNLSHLFININYVLCSSSKRTNQTLSELKDCLNSNAEIVITDELYECSLNTFLSLINDLDEKHNNVLIIAHNPTLSKLINNIDTKNIVFYSFATSDIAEIEINNTWNLVDFCDMGLVNFYQNQLIE